MPAIDKVLFATFCLRQAEFCGVNAHYLAAVAQLRSGIADDTVNTEIGPFRFTAVSWEQSRKNAEFAPDFEPEDIGSWRMQCAVFARMTNASLQALVNANAGQTPSALELYVAQLVAGGASKPSTAELEVLAGKLDTALEETRSAILRAEATSLADAAMPAGAETTPQTVLFRRVPGIAVVKGHLIAKMQNALIQRGHLAAADDQGQRNDDGIFGEITENAIEAWQTASGHPSTGALTFGEWRELTGLPPPDIYERCAQITAAFEGTGFGGTNRTDFDDTVLTFGYHGYTITGGNLQKFLKEIDQKHPTLLNASFGAVKASQLRTLFPPVSVENASNIGRGLFQLDNIVKDEWRAAFKTFGETPEAQQGQIEFSRENYWTLAERMRGILRLSQPLSHALCFDVAVQNGNRVALAKSTANSFFEAMDEAARRKAFGESVASKAKVEFRSDVRKRKVATLGEGVGEVHGETYRLANWGFAEAETAETNDSPGPTFPASENATFAAFIADHFPGQSAFSANEFLVKGSKHATNHLNTDPPQVLWPNIVSTIRVLLELKMRLGNPAITLNSVFRSRAYNASVGGALDSQHMKFTAVDFVAHDGKSPQIWAAMLHRMRDEKKFVGGIGLYSSFVHVDTRGYNANWG